MLKMLTDDWKSDKPHAIWDSVKNRVLGITTESTVNNDDHEKTLMGSITKQLSAIRGVNNNPPNPASSQQNNPQPPESQLPTNQAGTQGTAPAQPVNSIGSERLSTQVMRPSFYGSLLSRPPMKLPGVQKTNSGNSGNTPPRHSVLPSSASRTSASQPVPSSNGASTPKLIPNGTDQLVDQKRRSLEDAEEIREPKRLKEDDKFSGLKRSLEDAEDNRDFKMHSTAGPPQLKA
jgi:hypothetical protein